MKRIIPFVAFIALLATYCAREQGESSRDEEMMLLNATINEYYKDAIMLRDDGLWLVEDAKLNVGEKVEDGVYVTFDYKGWLLPISNSKVFQTTDSIEAKLLGAFSPSTHYAPYFLLDTTTMQTALYEAINTMRVGDTATFLSSSWLVASSAPILFRIILHGIERNPAQRELNWVNDYKNKHPEFVAPKDAEGNEYAGIYVRYADTVKVSDTTPYAVTGNVLNLKYAGFYVEDNFLLDANIGEIANQYKWDTTGSTYKNFYTHTFTETVSGNYSIKAFDIALRNVAPKSWIEVVFTSDYGYGASGNMGNSARPIYPYTPLRFRVYFSDIQ
ncbi:MAG: hypothetical protein ACRC3G_04195 [Bacteroidales bacterium]